MGEGGITQDWIVRAKTANTKRRCADDDPRNMGVADEIGTHPTWFGRSVEGALAQIQGIEHGARLPNDQQFGVTGNIERSWQPIAGFGQDDIFFDD